MPENVKIGNQTAFPAEPSELPFQFAIDNGFDAFEWFSDRKPWGQGWHIDDAGKEDRLRIRQQAHRHGIALSVHCPAEANPLSDGFQDLFNRHVEFACDVGASNINTHLFTEHGIENYLKSLTAAIEITARAKVRLSIENTTITGPDDFNYLFSLIKPLAAKHVGMCLDIGHANIFHETRNDFIRYIDRLSNAVPIIHIHAHENYGDCDSHLTLFTGPSQTNSLGIRGFVKRMKERRFKGMIIMEQWPSPPELLINARHGLSDFFKD